MNFIVRNPSVKCIQLYQTLTKSKINLYITTNKVTTILKVKHKFTK